MSTLNINDISNELDQSQLEDQSHYDGPSGGFTFRRIPIGGHPARLIHYIELGVQPQRSFGKEERPDCEQATLTFEFLGKRTIDEVDGKLVPMRKSITLKKSFHEKAGYRKLFEAMRMGDTSITHMSQMVGKGAWIIKCEWTTKNEDGTKIVIPASKVAEYEKRYEDAAEADKKKFAIYDNIKNAGGYLISAPVRPVLDEDGEDTGEVQKVAVREHIGELRLFIWDQPKPMFWDSLYIDGEYTREVDGKEKKFSKNRYQNAILEAKNFAGSPIEAMLGGVDNLPGMTDNGDVVDDADEAPETPKAPAKEVPAEEPAGDKEEDEFEEMGL